MTVARVARPLRHQTETSGALGRACEEGAEPLSCVLCSTELWAGRHRSSGSDWVPAFCLMDMVGSLTCQSVNSAANHICKQGSHGHGNPGKVMI